MDRKELDDVLDRVRSWPAERQEDVIKLLLFMEEQGTDVYHLSPEEHADIEEALAEADRGEVVPAEEVAAFFNRFRQ